jgi:hypothetical protein
VPVPTLTAQNILGDYERQSQFSAPDRFTRFASEARFVERALDWKERGYSQADLEGKSVYTSFRTERDENGNWYVDIYPNVQELEDGSAQEFSGDDAYQRAIETGNILRIPAGRSKKEIERAEKLALDWTKGFSDYLGGTND